MSLQDHLTNVNLCPFTAFYLEHAKDTRNITESLTYVSEAKRRIENQARKLEEESNNGTNTD